jgi:glycine hydroxymethyltransferase
VNPGGIRLGTPALTTRGMVEKDMERVAEFLLKGIEITLRIQKQVGKQLKDFIPAIENDEEILQVRE